LEAKQSFTFYLLSSFLYLILFLFCIFRFISSFYLSFLPILFGFGESSTGKKNTFLLSDLA